MSLYPEHVVVSCSTPAGGLELAMGGVLVDGLPVLAGVRPARPGAGAVNGASLGTARRARDAVAVAFVLNGFCFATLVTRFPDVRAALDLTNGALGLLLFAIAAGSVLALPSSGLLIARWGAATVVRSGSVLVAAGMTVAAVGAAVTGTVPLVAVGFFAYGVGSGLWDVAMNVEGAAVEKRLSRNVMPRFHAGWSMGSIAGAALGVPVAALEVPLPAHLGVVAVASAVVLVLRVQAFLPLEPVDHTAARGRSAWLEPRTLAVGLMVFAFALTEGAANDWLALALIDGYDAPHWAGVAGFAVFVTAMTLGRLGGTALLDRFGRVRVLRVTAVAAIAGLLLVVFGGHPVIVVTGILVWGLGASLGFPVGMSAAADDPARSAARVSVVATIGYAAFLSGPPVLGFIGDQVGTLRALLVVAVLLVPSVLVVGVAREPAQRGGEAGR